MPGMEYDIEVRDLPGQHAVAIRDTAAAKGLGPAMRQLYPVVRAFLEKRGIEPAGPSFGLYHSFSEDEVDFEAGFPVASPVEGEGRVRAIEIPATRAAVAVHVGPYTTISRAHDALDAWVHDQGHDHTRDVLEVYLVGPGDTEDSTTWRTEVIYPLER
jgi:effector-binding domain-containing protein